MEHVTRSGRTRQSDRKPRASTSPAGADIRSFTTLDDDETEIEVRALGTPEVLAIRTADVQLVRTAIQELPIKYREVLIMREIEGMSYSEMAKVLDIPMGSVASTLLRARERLKKQLIKSTRRRPSQELVSCR